VRTLTLRRWLGLVVAGAAAVRLHTASRRKDDVGGGPSQLALPSRGPESAPPRPEAPETDEAPGVEPDDKQARSDDKDGGTRGLLRAILADHKALVSLVGVLIYGVVRVAYDAFYTRLGVFPEAVGLSETTILGRAALYLAITVSITVVAGGLWLLAVSLQLKRSGAPSGDVGRSQRRLLTGALILTALCGVLMATSEQFRALLGSQRLTHYCLTRCKFNVLNAEILGDTRSSVHRASPERDFSIVVLGRAWLVVLPLVVLLIACAVGLYQARARSQVRTTPAASLFGLFVLGSVTSALAAPLVVKLTAQAADEAGKAGDASFIDAHMNLVRWLLIALPLVAIAFGLLATLSPALAERPWRSRWVIASFVALSPVLLGLFEQQIVLFVEEEGLPSLMAALVLLGALLALCFLWPRNEPGDGPPRNGLGDSPPRNGLADSPARDRNRTPWLAVAVAAVVWSTLFLAWERGLNLGSQAAVGDQIYPKRFSLLSVRSSVVCLRPTQKNERHSRTPFVYLGQVGGTLVLYDYVRDIGEDIPESFPVRMPAADVDLRLAELRPHRGWVCPR
jgi:hypothetical protein